jgi:acetyl esterase/lipase
MRVNASLQGRLLATFRCTAPARCGAIARSGVSWPARVASDVAPLTNGPGRTLKFGVMPRISLPSHLPIMRAFAVLTLLLVLRSSTEPQAPLQPDVRIYKRIGTTTLNTYIFMPGGPVNATPRAAIVLLHGGGWSTGVRSGCMTTRSAMRDWEWSP